MHGLVYLIALVIDGALQSGLEVVRLVRSVLQLRDQCLLGGVVERLLGILFTIVLVLARIGLVIVLIALEDDLVGHGEEVLLIVN